MSVQHVRISEYSSLMLLDASPFVFAPLQYTTPLSRRRVT